MLKIKFSENSAETDWKSWNSKLEFPVVFSPIDDSPWPIFKLFFFSSWESRWRIQLAALTCFQSICKPIWWCYISIIFLFSLETSCYGILLCLLELQLAAIKSMLHLFFKLFLAANLMMFCYQLSYMSIYLPTYLPTYLLLFICLH